MRPLNRALGIALVLFGGAVTYLNWPGKVTEWNFSKSHSLAVVEWPQSVPSDIDLVSLVASRNEILRVVLPEGCTIESPFERVHVHRRGKNIFGFQIDLEPVTAKTAVATARRFLKKFGCSPVRFDEWESKYRNVLTRPSVAPTFCYYEQRAGYQCGVKVRDSFSTYSPWIVSVEVYFDCDTESPQHPGLQGSDGTTPATSVDLPSGETAD
ncbi:MAG: hypothetical protein K8T25_07240 [Planctomycetia bacterium]|nr:hypothetical protein [Planctomycetia bacterium]